MEQLEGVCIQAADINTPDVACWIQLAQKQVEIAMCNTFHSLFPKRLNPGTVTTMETLDQHLISDAEKARRKAEVDFARGSVRFEGIVLSDAVEMLNQRYINGAISSEQHAALGVALIQQKHLAAA